MTTSGGEMQARPWGLCALLLAGALQAQEATTPATIPVEALPQAEDPEAGLRIDEVVVTARRKEERAVDVPASLAVLDGESLGEAGLTLPTDLQERVPGLVVSVPNARLTSYTIRGLGSSSANDGIESSVGLFLDGVYLGRQGLSVFDLIDLDRVEILRGPQGTLFGKNTTAGAISIVTKLPSDQYEADLEVGGGDIGARQVRGSLNDVIADGELAGRLTGYLSDREGTVFNQFNGEQLNNRHKYGLRGQLLWTPTELLSGRFIAEYSRNEEVCCAFPLTGPVRNAVVQRDAYMEYDRIGTDPAERITDSDAPTNSRMRQQALSAEFNRDIGEKHRLTSISAARHWFFVPLNDDATSLKLASTSTLNDHRQYSQELRLSSEYEGFDSVIGLFYIHQELDGLERVILGEDIAGWVFGGVIRERSGQDFTESNSGDALYALIPPESLDGLTVDTAYGQRSDSLAVFTSVDWHLNEQFDLTTGLRYTYEWKKAAVDRHRYGGDTSASPLATADPILPIIDATFPELGQALGSDLQSFGFNGIVDDVAGGEYQRADRLKEGNFSGQLALSMKLSSDAMAYASVARGYKGGGINLGFTGESIKPTFRPERATSFEIGSKARLFDRRLSVGFAVYDTRITDYQALTFDNEDTLLPNPRQINLLNVGKVRLRGAELEGYGYALPGLMIRAGAAYSRAITTEFPNAPNENSRANDQDLSGQDLYNAPRWTTSAGAEYSYFLDNGWELFAGLDYSSRTGYFGTVEHGRASYIEAYELANARGGLRSGDRLWDVSAWSRNLMDKDYVATVYPLYGVGDYGAVPADPRTYGLSLRIKLR